MSGQITPAALIPALPAVLMGIVLFLTARKLRVERERAETGPIPENPTEDAGGNRLVGTLRRVCQGAAPQLSVSEAAQLWAVVVVLLAIALIVVNAAGIRIYKPAPEAPAATNLPQFPFSDEPELILGSGQAPSRDAQQAVSVGGVDKTMQLVNGSFAQRGGPDFSLYLDTSVFLSTEMDGKCCFARADDTSMDAYLEIGYHPGADAQTLAGTILNDYGTIANTETLGQVKLGDLNAYGVNGATVQKQLEAYLIQTADGCVSVVLCRAGTAPAGWYESLLASAQTLQITG